MTCSKSTIDVAAAANAGLYGMRIVQAQRHRGIGGWARATALRVARLLPNLRHDAPPRNTGPLSDRPYA